MTKTSPKTTKTAKTNFVANLKTPAIVRKGFQAYVGLHGAAFERALPVFEAAVKNYDDYAARGEKLETAATTYAKDTSKTVSEFATKRFEKRAAQLRSILPSAANDRVKELEAEVAKLTSKIASAAKTTTKKVAKTAEKIVADKAA